MGGHDVVAAPASWGWGRGCCGIRGAWPESLWAKIFPNELALRYLGDLRTKQDLFLYYYPDKGSYEEVVCVHVGVWDGG